MGPYSSFRTWASSANRIRGEIYIYIYIYTCIRRSDKLHNRRNPKRILGLGLKKTREPEEKRSSIAPMRTRGLVQQVPVVQTGGGARRTKSSTCCSGATGEGQRNRLLRVTIVSLKIDTRAQKQIFTVKINEKLIPIVSTVVQLELSRYFNFTLVRVLSKELNCHLLISICTLVQKSWDHVPFVNLQTGSLTSCAGINFLSQNCNIFWVSSIYKQNRQSR